MFFDSVGAFLAMGGHALYVWLAYGATLLVMLGYWLGLRISERRLLKRLTWQAMMVEPDAGTTEQNSRDVT